MGGGSGGPSSSTTYTSNLPEYARPYFERMMERTEAESNQPYVGYKGERLAGFTGDTQAGFQATRDIAARGTPESAQAIQIAGQAGAAGAGDINAARGGGWPSWEYGWLHSRGWCASDAVCPSGVL